MPVNKEYAPTKKETPASETELQAAREVLSHVVLKRYYSLLVENGVDQLSASVQAGKLLELPVGCQTLKTKMKAVKEIGLVKP